MSHLKARHDLATATSDVHVLPVSAASAAHPVDVHDTERLIAVSDAMAREELPQLRAGADSAGTPFAPWTSSVTVKEQR